jgi:hypothetical protein
MIMKKMLFAGAISLGLALSLAACGGDDDDDTAPDGTSSASSSASGSAAATSSAAASSSASASGTAQSSATSTSTATSTSEATRTTAASPGGSDDALEDFIDLSEGVEDRTYRVLYNITSLVEGEENEGTWEIQQDPPRSSSSIFYGGDEPATFSFIDDGTDTYTCIEAGDEGQCLRGSLGSDIAPIDPDEAADELEGKNVQEIDGREIAGRDARCFEYTGDTDEESGVICVDEDTGVMLLLQSGDVLIEATEFGTGVDDDAFEPQFEVVG